MAMLEETQEDLVVTAHWMLGKLATISANTQVLASDHPTDSTDRQRLLSDLLAAVDECSSVLIDLTRGVPASVAGVPYVSR